MSSSSDAQEFLDDLYSKYLARKGKPLTIRTIEDKTIVSEYKPVSARTLQREGRDYSSFIVSPFEPVTIKEAKPKEKNPLILESSIDKKPKMAFSLLEWVKQMQSSKAVYYPSSSFIVNGELVKDTSFIKVGYLIKDDNLNYVANSLEDLVLGFAPPGSNNNDPNPYSFIVKEVFETHQNDTDPDTGMRMFNEPLFGSDDAGLFSSVLIDDMFLARRGIQNLYELEDVYFSFKEIIKLGYNIDKDEEGRELFYDAYLDKIIGYFKDNHLLNQYSLNLRSIFLLKNKNFSTLPEASNMILIMSTELNKGYKEKILNLNLDDDLFIIKRYKVVDDRVPEEMKHLEKDGVDYYFTPEKNIKKIGFPIVNPRVLDYINLINNYELVNNYLTEYTFINNPINLKDFQSFEYEKIVFTQEELVNAKFKNFEGKILEDGPSIYSEEDNSFKSILKKYLIYEIDNLENYYLEFKNNNRVLDIRNSIWNVLINLVWERIQPLMEAGIVLKTNYSLDPGDSFRTIRGSLDVMLKYSSQLLYVIKNPETENYYANFSNEVKPKEYSLEEIKYFFFITMYSRVIEALEYTIFNADEALAFELNGESSNPGLFESYLNDSQNSIVDLLPDISIVYSEDAMNSLELDPITDLNQRTIWTTVVDFARDENLKSKSTEANSVAKVKDFLNALSTKVQSIKEENKEEYGIIKNIGSYNIDLISNGAGNESLWRVKDQFGKLIDDYYDIAMELMLAEFHIINPKTLSKFKNKQKSLKTLSNIKENEDFKNIKNGFSIIRNSIPSVIELFNRFYDPNYFIDKAFEQRNSKEIQVQLKKTKSSLEAILGKSAIVKIGNKIGFIFNFDPLICYGLDLLNLDGISEELGSFYATKPYNIYPILYPYSNVSIADINEAYEVVRTFHPNLLGFYNLWDEASDTTYSNEIKRKHISFPGYYQPFENKFSGYNFKNMPVLSAGVYSRSPMAAPENPEKRTVIDEFYIINDPSYFSPNREMPRLTEIFYERHHRQRSFRMELKATGNPSLIKELKKEDLKNKADLKLGIPVFFLSTKSESEEYFTNKEMLVDLDKIEAIYFFDKKDYNPQKEVDKTSSKNTKYSSKARK